MATKKDARLESRASSVMEPERLMDQRAIHFTPSVSHNGSFPEWSCSCRVLLPERFIRFRLTQICTFGAQCCYSAVYLPNIRYETLPCELLNCYLDSKVECDDRQGKRCMTLVWVYLPATLRTRFGFSDSSASAEGSSRAGSSGALVNSMEEGDSTGTVVEGRIRTLLERAKYSFTD